MSSNQITHQKACQIAFFQKMYIDYAMLPDVSQEPIPNYFGYQRPCIGKKMPFFGVKSLNGTTDRAVRDVSNEFSLPGRPFQAVRK